MPIVNPNIILSAVQPRQSPTSSLSSALTIQTQRERLKTERLQRQAAEADAADQTRLRDIFATADPNNPDAAIGEVMRVSPSAGLKLRSQASDADKARHERDKAEIATKLERATAVTQILQSVTDEASFQAAREKVGQVLGPQYADDLGDTYDKARVGAHVAAGMKTTEYLKAVDDQLTRAEVNRHNTAGETENNRSNVAREGETVRHNQAGEVDAARDTSSRIGDRGKRTRIYEADLKGDRTETKRHNTVNEILSAQEKTVGGGAGDKQDFEEYKLYVQQWDRQQQARAKAAGAEVDDNGDPVGYDYQMPPAFAEWRTTLEKGTRQRATILPGDRQLPPSTSPIASAVAPPPPAVGAPMPTPAPPATPASAPRPDVQVGSIVTLRDGRRMYVTGIDPVTGKAKGRPVEGAR